MANPDGGPLVLPQTPVGANSAISGEFGSASEGILQDSVNGAYLTIMGYGVNAAAFNTAGLAGTSSPYGTPALGQTTSLTAAAQLAANPSGPVNITVPRVVALVGANGSVDTSTALTGVFNMNNPRSVATVDGSSFYVSGQGVTGDGTGGVFYATDGATTATAINANVDNPVTGAESATAATGTETRSVEIVNVNGTETLEASRDFSVSGTPNDATDIRSFTTSSGALPTSASGLTVTRVLPNSLTTGSKPNFSSINLTAGTANGVNNVGTNSRVGSFVYLSPEQFFLAAPNVMYVADSGEPKNGSVDAAGVGEGGLQKWVNSAADGSGTWSLAYDLVAGLNLVNNDGANSATPTADGVTGLFGLAGEVVGGNVELFATSYGLNELSQSYVYGITDTLADTTIAQANGEDFSTLYTDSTGQTSIRGVAFAPEAVPEPSTFSLLVPVLLGLGAFAWKRRQQQRA